MNVREDQPATLAGFRVLVVEDDPFIAADLDEQLGSMGATVVGPVPSIGAALATLRTERPDAVVLDVNLRSERSAPVADASRAADVPFVLATGYSRGQLDEPAFRDAPLISKPVRIAELARVLRQVISSGANDAGDPTRAGQNSRETDPGSAEPVQSAGCDVPL